MSMYDVVNSIYLYQFDPYSVSFRRIVRRFIRSSFSYFMYMHNIQLGTTHAKRFKFHLALGITSTKNSLRHLVEISGRTHCRQCLCKPSYHDQLRYQTSLDNHR